MLPSHLNERKKEVKMSKSMSVSIDAAMSAAISSVDPNHTSTPRCLYEVENGYYRIDVVTDWMQYEVYVDCDNGEVVGCNPTPVESKYYGHM